jgi:hypothetical protein
MLVGQQGADVLAGQLFLYISTDWSVPRMVQLHRSTSHIVLIYQDFSVDSGGPNFLNFILTAAALELTDLFLAYIE